MFVVLATARAASAQPSIRETAGFAPEGWDADGSVVYLWRMATGIQYSHCLVERQPLLETASALS